MTTVRFPADLERNSANTFRIWRFARRAYSDDFLAPGQATLVTATKGVTNASEYIIFAAGATSDAHWTIPKKRLWQLGGSIRFTMVYSGTTGNTNNIDMRLAASEEAVGDDYTTGLDINNTDLFAGPAADSLVATHEFDTLLPVAGDGIVIPVRLRRVNTDTYTGDVRCMGLYWEYLSKR